MSLYLSRLTLRHDPQANALAALIDPDGPAQAFGAHHRLIWSAFADGPARRRDFLWRAEGGGRFMILSARAPIESPQFGILDVTGMLRVTEPAIFTARLGAGFGRPRPSAAG